MGYKRRNLRIGPPLGSRNPASKLDEHKVRQIRERYSFKPNGRNRNPNGALALAEEFGVSRNTIQAIAHGVLWGWID